MTEKRIAEKHHATFESLRHFDADGNEYWQARQLAGVLEYSQYRHFLPVVERAKEACTNSGQSVADHFEDILKMVEIGSGATRNIEDIRLSRYACYLIVQNADPAKPIVANGQTYFAIQTRRQELADDAAFARLSEDEKRLAIRNELAQHNKYLAAAAKEAGVETSLDYAIFQDHGYCGLYGGLTAKEIHARKKLKKVRKFLSTWGAPKWRPISSARHRPKKSSSASKCGENNGPTKPITRSGRKSGRRSKSWVEPCPKRCRLQSKASSRSKVPGKSSKRSRATLIRLRGEEVSQKNQSS